jgi:DNA-binding FrmR family transcriptional regulator
MAPKNMPPKVEKRKKLLNRARRIRGQVDVVVRTLEEKSECSETLHAISVCRGALDSLMAEVIESHIFLHVLDQERDPTKEQTGAAEDLIDALRTYLK